MRKFVVLMLAAGLSLAIGCKKKEAPIIVDPPPPSACYFKFKFDGVGHYVSADIPQYMPFHANEAGGYQVTDTSVSPSVGLRLSWPVNDTVSEADLMALKGKTLYFSDTAVHPTLTYSPDLATTDWKSLDTNNTSYNVTITNITFLKNDTTAGTPVKAYMIKGTCNALMSRSGTVSNFSDGEFNIVISRKDL